VRGRGRTEIRLEATGRGLAGEDGHVVELACLFGNLPLGCVPVGLPDAEIVIDERLELAACIL
jgi:hypothetical protein